MRSIPYSCQSVTAADIRAVVNVLRSDFLTQGPAIPAFEKELARTAGTRYCAVFSSGTAALHGACAAAGLGKGDEVIVPALTFAASANAVLYVGAKPVFADVDIETGNIDPHDVERKITKRTRSIISVDYAGRPADYTALRRIAKKHKLLLIADAAHSLGASYKGRPVGSLADMTMFSFHPVKSITTGEGGAIATNSKEFYIKLLAFRHHGIVKDRTLFKKKHAPAWHQEMQSLGYNYRLTDIQAALGLSQLKRLRAHIAKRRALAHRYKKLASSIPGLILPPSDSKDAHSAWHLFPIRVAEPSARARVFNALRNVGIAVQVHYLPVYLHPYYQKLGYGKELCPRAESFYASEISIPLFPDLTLREQDRVIRELRKVL